MSMKGHHSNLYLEIIKKFSNKSFLRCFLRFFLLYKFSRCSKLNSQVAENPVLINFVNIMFLN